LFDEAAARLKRTVPFDGACWHTLDPGSDLITQHRLQDLPDRFPVLANNEYAVEDVNKFDQLARAERKAATMNEATGGHPERSQRFRDLPRRAARQRLGILRARRPPRADRRGVRTLRCSSQRSGGRRARRFRRALVAPLLLKAYGLTPREQEVTQLMLRGATTIQAAQRLAISPHTITDHIKSIFEKTGARTRGELSATLFFGEHLPRIESRMAVGDDASFIDAPRPRGRDTAPPSPPT
jgi:DNA-binding CsgD family transcriptional regulator